MTRFLGYLYLHAPDPDNRGQYVTYRIAVEETGDTSYNAGEPEEADDEQD
ncbi:hypothetical protein [Rhizorhapis suberifaciens]|uniref:Uncharacterized protein n=1 Tax=Rhizorhapis suberifaciens TaxID=13656 RepID=A0A840HP63_9SPHN|nr:hypothetical protein [Rhizorhapis suberifaciens]MBB4639832.1 hypothetical protein [Rhizorhapis suberifaciens]